MGCHAQPRTCRCADEIVFAAIGQSSRISPAKRTADTCFTKAVFTLGPIEANLVIWASTFIRRDAKRVWKIVLRTTNESTANRIIQTSRNRFTVHAVDNAITVIVQTVTPLKFHAFANPMDA